MRTLTPSLVLITGVLASSFGCRIQRQLPTPEKSDDCVEPITFPLPAVIPEAVLAAAKELEPGMTRADVLIRFTEEGGLSFRDQKTYVYRGCPTAKITVEFKPVDPKSQAERADDRIVRVSAPFRQLTSAD